MRNQWWRRLRTSAGPERTERNNRYLAGGLAFTAGMVNSVGFLAVAIYTSHMTGLTAILADQIVLGGYTAALHAALGGGSFIVGAMMCAIIFNWGRRRGHESKFALVLFIEALATLLIGLLAEKTTDLGLIWPVVMVLCWTMGLQNALITKVTDAQIRTTHVTGMVTDIGIELGKFLYRNRPDDPDPVRASGSRLQLHTMIVGLFFLGGVVGALLGSAISFLTVLPAAAILFLLSSFPIYADLRSGAFVRPCPRGADVRNAGWRGPGSRRR